MAHPPQLTIGQARPIVLACAARTGSFGQLRTSGAANTGNLNDPVPI
jgi:hypothetical protein